MQLVHEFVAPYTPLIREGAVEAVVDEFKLAEQLTGSKDGIFNLGECGIVQFRAPIIFRLVLYDPTWQGEVQMTQPLVWTGVRKSCSRHTWPRIATGQISPGICTMKTLVSGTEVMIRPRGISLSCGEKAHDADSVPFAIAAENDDSGGEDGASAGPGSAGGGGAPGGKGGGGGGGGQSSGACAGPSAGEQL